MPFVPLLPKGRKRLRHFEETSMRFIPQPKGQGFLAWIHVENANNFILKHLPTAF